MIPKTIHYFWFGRGEKPDKIKYCIDTWHKMMPDYEIKEWNEDNYDVRKHRYTSEAYDAKVWSFITDYARHDIIYRNGGIYLDTDVELIKSLDPIVKLGKPFGGIDSMGWFTSGLGMGGPAGARIFKLLMGDYVCSSVFRKDGSVRYNINCQHEINVMTKLGLRRWCKEICEIGGMVLYPQEYFCPLDFATDKLEITPNTYSIHHYTCTWMPDKMKQRLVEQHPELQERYKSN